jgi:RND family efflux transporter MFP subunit
VTMPESGRAADDRNAVAGGPEATGDAVAPSTPPLVGGRRRRRIRWVLAAAVVLCASGTGVGLGLAGGGGGSPEGARQHLQIVDVRAVEGTMEQTVAAEGDIQPAQIDNLNFAVSGQVTAVDVTIDQQVKAGQTLATIADTALVAQVDADSAQLEGAQAQLSADQASGSSTVQITADKDAVTADQAQLATAQKQVAGATLTSPITGTVAEVDLTVGQEAGASRGSVARVSTQETGGTPGGGAEVLVISTNQFVVDAAVDQTVISQLAVGQSAIIDATGTPGPVDGTVAFVSMVPNGDSGIPSYPITVDVDGAPSDVFAGSQAKVSVVVSSISDAVEIPTAALHYAGGEVTVTEVHAGGADTTVPVTVGVTSNGMTQITKGLSAGAELLEPVVTSGRSSSNGGSKPSIRRGTAFYSGATGATAAQRSMVAR